MGKWLIGIVLQAGVILISGLLLAYLGFLSPVFRRSSERLAPDRWVGIFRNVARVVGPLLCIAAGLQAFFGIRQETAVQDLHWHDFTSPDRRFRVSSPADFVEEVRDEPYGRESCFHAVMPNLGFLVSYIDLPAEILKNQPNAVLNTELDQRLQATKLEPLRRETTRLKDYPAVRFKLHNVPGGYFVEGILLLAKGRRYQLAVQYTSEASMPTCDQFFNSFQVLDGP